MRRLSLSLRVAKLCLALALLALGNESCSSGSGGALWRRDAASPVLRFSSLLLTGNPTIAFNASRAVPYGLWFTGLRPGQFRLELFQASSSDGVAWTVNESTPVFSYGTDWDMGGVETPNVLRVGSQYLMYYTGYSDISDLSTYGIGRAVSPDGISWQRTGSGPIFPGTEPSVLFEGGRYRMWWYRFDRPVGQRGVYYSESSDGVTGWSSPVLTLAWDYAVEADTSAATVIRRSNGQLAMVLNMSGEKGASARATTSNDGQSWTVIGKILGHGASNDFDALHANAGTLLEDSAGKLRFWYLGWKVDPPSAPDQHALGLAHEP